jgi:hypothetical protein
MPIALTEGGGQADINKIPVSYADLSSLPGNPLALDRYFGSLPHGTMPAAVSEFQIIEDLVISYVMPPALTAELYRALGDVPGVTVNDHAVDEAGRTGIGFQISIPTPFNPHGVDQLILDPSTYEWIGYSGGSGMLGNNPTAVLQSSLVSGPGVLPSRG